MSKKSRLRAIADFVEIARQGAKPHFVASDVDEIASMLVLGWMWMRLVDEPSTGEKARRIVLNRMRALRN